MCAPAGMGRGRGRPPTACARHGRDKEGLDIRLGTLRRVALEGGSFDVVRLHNVLEHLPDPLGDLREASRLLRPGGLLVLSTINAASLAARMSGADWRYYEPHCHLYAFTPRTLRRMLGAAGFTSISIRTRGFRLGAHGAARRGARVPEGAAALAARILGMGHRMGAKALKPIVKRGSPDTRGVLY